MKRYFSRKILEYGKAESELSEVLDGPIAFICLQHKAVQPLFIVTTSSLPSTWISDSIWLSHGKETKTCMSDIEYAELQYKRLHFLGIGGRGMSAMAQIAKHFGAQVSGCDKGASYTTVALQEAGIPIENRHRPAPP